MPSFGEELKRERELRRITLREVADATKINLRYLEALDRNDFQHLPGGVFNRGFVRAYAQYIGVDADQMVSAYIMEVRSQSGNETGVDTSTDPLMRGNRSPAPMGTAELPPLQETAAEGLNPWLKVGLAALLAVILIAACVFAFFRFRSGNEIGERAGAATPNVVATALDQAPARPASSPPPVNTDPPPGQQPEESPVAPPAPARTIHATIHLDRATTGRVNCDNRRIELLDGMRPGTQLELACRTFLIVDAEDGGALRIGWPGVAPVALGDDGVPLAGHRIDPRAPSTAGPEERR